MGGVQSLLPTAGGVAETFSFPAWPVLSSSLYLSSWAPGFDPGFWKRAYSCLSSTTRLYVYMRVHVCLFGFYVHSRHSHPGPHGYMASIFTH